ncbi:hypothetical protein EXE44_20050, partial [Halorubrum sp. SS7]
AIRREVMAYRGGWLEQFDHRAPTAFNRQVGIVQSFWQIGGTMLLGMALYKWGVLTGDRSRRLYRRLVGV